AQTRSEEARAKGAVTPKVLAIVPAESFIRELQTIAPKLDLPRPDELKDKVLKLPFKYDESELILLLPGVTEPKRALISLAPLQTMTIYFMVCLVAGLVLASPWVFYQIWAFIAAGLYRHERHYVTKFLPLSLGLFL